MRKIFAAIILMGMFSSVTWGAGSDDIYVRKDVYQSDMRNINDKLDTILLELREQRKDINALSERVAVLSERIETVYTSLSERSDGLEKSLNKKIDGLEKSLNEKIDGLEKSLNERIDGVEKSLNERIDGVEKSLNKKIDGVEKSLTEKIDGVDKRLSARMDDLRNGFYLVLTLISVIIALPFVRKWYDEHKELRKPALTLEDVKKLIEENNTMLLGKIQGGIR